MKTILTYSLILISFCVNAQQKEKDKFLPKGNEAFEEKNYVDAEADYRISQSKFPKKAISGYNLGTSIYKQKQTSEAKYQFANALKKSKSKAEKHKIFHNLGNCLMNEKDYEGAVDAYKNALRNNPNDEQTRYNYALAKLYLKNNPPKSKDDKNKNKDQKQKEEEKKNKDKNKDKNDKNKDQDKDQGDKEKDKQNQEGNKKKDKNDSNKEDGKPQPNQGGISKQRLQNLLDAVNNEEKKVQDKVKKQKALTQPQQTEKDW